MHLTHPKYRADIDGLRAVAVLSVVGFHAFPYTVPSGFIGVDVFFVISGFLISTIVFSNLEKNTFSIADFYNRRISRIFPALITVTSFSLVLGWATLLTDEYKQLGKHVASGAVFISNFILWNESGYFDNEAELKPMLHLWSLAIEEQFYIFWPLLLAFFYNRKFSFLRITTVIAVVSFVANIYFIEKNISTAFYSPICRFWELMIGGILAYITLHRPEINSRFKNIQSSIGFALLLAGLIFINKNREFPGWWALLPTVGAFFLISAGQTAWINKTVLSNRTMVWFGLISYPLYLWHWPLLSFAKIISGDLSRDIILALVFLSIFLAWLTQRVIEKHLRFGKYKKKSLLLSSALAIIGLFGYSCIMNSGYDNLGFRGKGRSEFYSYFENEVPHQKYFERTGLLDKWRTKCDFYDIEMFKLGKSTQVPIDKIDKECYTKNADVENTLLIWGDSHGAQLYFGLRNNLPDNWQILQVTTSGCAPSISVQHDSTINWCDRSNWFALETIKSQRPNVLIVAQNTGHDFKKMASIGSALESLGVRKVIFTGPTPHWTSDLPKIIVRKLWNNTPRRTFVGINVNILKANQALKQDFTSSSTLHFVSIIDYFCDEKGCLTYMGSDKKLGITTWDHGHLTPVASDAFGKDVLAPLVVSPIRKPF